MKGPLAVMVLLLGGVLALQWYDWQSSARLPTPPAEPESTAAPVDSGPQGERSAADAQPPPRDEYAEVVERPLFLPDRRPPPEEEVEEPEPEAVETAELDGVDLTAVIITPDEVSAWLRAPGESKLQKRLLGEDFLGWTVKVIEPALIVFERQGETDEIHLRDYAKAPPAIPPTRLSSRGPTRRNVRGAPADSREPASGQRGADPSDAGAGADGSAEVPTPRQQRIQPQDRSPPARQPTTRRPTTGQ
jgi:general secretion pathway protein N